MECTMAGGTTQSVTSHGGLALPKIGLGTYTLNGFAGAEAIEAAIDMGYRLIDSAFNYENEGAAGAAIRASSVPPRPRPRQVDRRIQLPARAH